jgi:putative DNA primase/helicase
MGKLSLSTPLRETRDGIELPPQLDIHAPSGGVATVPAIVPLITDSTESNPPESDRPALLDPRNINGLGLAKALLADLKAHCYLAPHAATAIVLWTLHTYAIGHRDFSPILALTSDTPETGKSTVLDWLATVVSNPLATSNPSARILIPIVNECEPTLLLDDISRIGSRLSDLLVTGHKKSKASILAPGKKNQPLSRLSTWAPKAIARIGHIPEVIASRSIEIQMDCKPAALKLKRPDPRQRNEALALDAAQWVMVHSKAIAAATPELPPSIGNRLRDNWEPLLAIADLLGGQWPVQAREALLKLRNDQDTASSTDILLLNGIRSYFKRSKVTTAFTDEILTWFNAEFNLNTPKNRLTAKTLAAALSHFKIRSNHTVRRDSHTAKGYYLTWFTGAFERYLCEDPALPQSQDYAPADNLPALEAQSQKFQLAAAVTPASVTTLPN